MWATIERFQSMESVQPIQPVHPVTRAVRSVGAVGRLRWHRQAVWMCTGADSATARNAREEPRVRLALPDAFDVVLLEGTATCHPAHEAPADAADAFAEKFGWDPRTEGTPYVYLCAVPRTVRAWRGVPELRARVVMREGEWRE